MPDATCSTCPWWKTNRQKRDPYTGNLKPLDGRCRIAPPITGGAHWPTTTPDDWCSHHPDRAPQMTACVSEVERLTEADVRRIVWKVLDEESGDD